MKVSNGALVIIALLVTGCQAASDPPHTLRTFAVDNMDGVLTQSGVSLDTAVSSDGNGSLRIDATAPTVVRLYELPGPFADDGRLVYRAKVKAEKLDGQAFLEMWCAFPGMGEYFSRSLQSPISGTVDWSTVETPFFLKRGQKPDLIKLNIVVNGRGTVWIDDITLMRGPLK